MSFVALPVIVAVLGVHVAYYAPFLSDDALISLRYADRFADGLGLTWTDGERVEGYTDLLWVLLTAALHWLGVDLIFAARALAFLGCVAGALIVSLEPKTGKPSLERCLTGGLGLALCAPVAIWGIGALEHGFMVGVIIAALFVIARAEEERVLGRSTWTAALLLAALVLLRADGAILVFGLVLPTLFVRGPGAIKKFLLWAGLPMLALLGQHLFRYSYYGEWVPNTALAKVALNEDRVILGLRHVTKGLSTIWPILVGAAVVLAAGVRSMRLSTWGPALFSSLVWCGYLALVGGDIFPGFRQLLLGLVPLYFLFSQATAAALRRYPREALSLHLAALIVSALSFSTQSRDSENRRGKSERWEWAGASVGPVLKRAFGSQKPLLGVDAAGALPFWSELPSLDMLGLNDSFLAHHPPPNFGRGGIGHELGNGAYVLSRKPDLIAFNNAQGARHPAFLSGREMVRTAEFRKNYSLMLIQGDGPVRAVGEIYGRKDGRVGFRRVGGVTEIPGYFLSQGNAFAKLGPDGTLVTSLEPGRVARLEGLELEPGNYRLTVQASTADLEVAVRCQGRTMTGTPSLLPIIAVAPHRPISILVASRGQPGFLRSVRLEKVSANASLQCASGLIRTNLGALASAKAENTVWDAPSNVVFSGRPLVVALPGISRARAVSLSVDNNDDYDVEFFAGGERRGAIKVEKRNNGGGLAVHRVQIGDDVHQKGFDEVRIRGKGGDGSYSLGHLIFE